MDDRLLETLKPIDPDRIVRLKLPGHPERVYESRGSSIRTVYGLFEFIPS